MIWASFARYSVAKNFQKSPDLVTLHGLQHLIIMLYLGLGVE